MTISSEGWFGLKAITLIPVGYVEQEILRNIAASLENTLRIKAELGSAIHQAELGSAIHQAIRTRTTFLHASDQ
jgi:hypothetical protein